MAALGRRRLFLVVGGAIFAAGLAGGAWKWRQAERLALANLTEHARGCAVAFYGGDLDRLSGTRADLESPEYTAVKERLMELRRAQNGVRFVYLFRARPDGRTVVFLADSEPAYSKDVSLPGDEFPEAASSPGLQTILTTGRPATEGPLRDSFGVWVTAYAPIVSKSPTKMPPDIIGLDVAADDWRAGLFEQGFRTALYIWLLLGLPLGAQVLVRRWGVQERTIRKLSTAIEQSRSALLIAGNDGRIEYVNRGMCEQIGYAAEELIGKSWKELGIDPPAVLWEATRAGRVWEGALESRRKSGDVYPVNGVITPVMERGRVQCFLAALQDMTEAKRIEADLRVAKERAEAGERAKNEFLNTMSHELRTPLNGIVGFTSLLLDTELTAEQREYVQTVRSSGGALLRLTGDILDYSRMESRPPPLALVSCEVRVLLDEVLDLSGAGAAEKGVSILHHVAKEVPAVASVDAVRLRQVLTHLVGNAVKFTATGEVEVRVRARAGDTPLGEDLLLDFSVRDSGPGISDEDQKRLFQPFTQLDNALNRRHGGTGLGLAISQAAVRLMGGEITLRSKPGRGSMFRFTVPVRSIERRTESLVLEGRRVGLVVHSPGMFRELFGVISLAGGVPVTCQLEDIIRGGLVDLAVIDCDQSAVARVLAPQVGANRRSMGILVGLISRANDVEERRRLRDVFHALMEKPLRHDALVATLNSCIRSKNTGRSQPQFDLRVLIVDDNVVNQRHLRGVVTTLGCRSMTASTGREALDVLSREGDFDLVLLDQRMPDMDAREVLRRVRAGDAGESARGVWVTVMTANAEVEVQTALFTAGCDDFVLKPITLASGVAALQRAQAGGERRAR